MKVKICGLTRAEDVALAVELGSTHVGFVLVPGTPRCISAQRARELSRDLPSDCAPVLVFRDASAAEVLAAAEIACVDRVQLHRFREADASELQRGGLHVHRVLAADERKSLPRLDPPPTEDAPWHLDVRGGGSGATFDWSLLGERAPELVFVAGGIRPANVASLLALRPWGIDVGSGVEASPGRKDHAALRDLFDRLEETS